MESIPKRRASLTWEPGLMPIRYLNRQGLGRRINPVAFQTRRSTASKRTRVVTLHRTAQPNHRVLISAVQRHLPGRYRHRPPLPFRSFDRPSDALQRVGLQPAGCTNGLFRWLVGDVNLGAIMPGVPSGARGVGRKIVRFCHGLARSGTGGNVDRGDDGGLPMSDRGFCR